MQARKQIEMFSLVGSGCESCSVAASNPSSHPNASPARVSWIHGCTGHGAGHQDTRKMLIAASVCWSNKKTPADTTPFARDRKAHNRHTIHLAEVPLAFQLAALAFWKSDRWIIGPRGGGLLLELVHRTLCPPTHPPTHPMERPKAIWDIA